VMLGGFESGFCRPIPKAKQGERDAKPKSGDAGDRR
jgi:hypothetical protein